MGAGEIAQRRGLLGTAVGRCYDQSYAPPAREDLVPGLGDGLQHGPDELDELLVRTGHDWIAPDGDRDVSSDRLWAVHRSCDDEVVDRAEPMGLEGDLIDDDRVTEKVEGRPDEEAGQDGGAVDVLQHYSTASGRVGARPRSCGWLVAHNRVAWTPEM